MVKDMTVGNPIKLLIGFTIPLLIGNIFQQLYSMVDTIIVGQVIGKDALGAVGVTGTISFLVLGFVLGITVGFSVIISQRFGAKDEEGLRKAVAMSVLLSVIISAVLTVVSVHYAKPLLILMKTSEDLLPGAVEYITVIYWGISATMCYNLLSAILRALGDSRTPLYILIISSILNIILDYVLMVPLHMGIAGAALATVIAQAISCVCCFIYIVKRFPILHLKRSDWKIDLQLCGHLIGLGLPAALQYSVTAIGGMFVQSTINVLGVDAVVAYTAANKVEQLAIQPMVSFGIAMGAYAGQNLGAGKFDRISEGIRKCILLSMSFCIGFGVIIYVFGRNLASLFMKKEEMTDLVLDYAVDYLHLASLFFCVLGLLFIYRNALQGLGNSIVPFFAGAMELVMRIVIASTLSHRIGFVGICWASPMAWVGATVLLIISYYIYFRKIKARLTAPKPAEV